MTRPEKKTIARKIARRAGWWFPCRFRRIAMEESVLYRNPAISNILLMVGDSRIAGGQWYTMKIPLRAENCGVGGSGASTNSLEWSSRMAIQWILLQHPQAVMLAMGVNDLGAGVPLKAILGGIQKIVFALREYTESRIFLHCGLPVIKHFDATNEDVRQLNELLKILAEENGIQYIDLFDEFVDPRTGMADMQYLADEVPAGLLGRLWPVHYNEHGYAHWYELLTEYFNRELKHG